MYQIRCIIDYLFLDNFIYNLLEMYSLLKQPVLLNNIPDIELIIILFTIFSMSSTDHLVSSFTLPDNM